MCSLVTKFYNLLWPAPACLWSEALSDSGAHVCVFLLGLRADCYLKWVNQQFSLSSKVSSKNGFVRELFFFFTSSEVNTKEALLDI